MPAMEGTLILMSSERSWFRTRAGAEGMLATDMYQLTMAQLYFRQGLHERPAQFEHFTRRYPDYGGHQAGYCVMAGMEWLLDWMEEAHITDDDIDYLRSLTGIEGSRLFADDFLSWLRINGSFEGVSLRAVPEGRVVHANAPLTMAKGPLAMAQILETQLLNELNFQTLVATKASRMTEAARGRPILEFGMRRGPERGATAASRASLVGGAAFTSNVGASQLAGLAPKGTHAHSMVQAFMALGEGELAAFRAYADVYPDDCLLLVDTIDTLDCGVPNAIVVFDELRAKGHRPVGIRLDSGDLAYLAIQSAARLNAAGFDETAIVLSSGLDEIAILQILAQIDGEAARYGVDPARLIARLTFGVGSKLATSEGHPYLGGVYKLVAIEDGGVMVPTIKISDTPGKTQNPGDKDAYRIYDERGRATADLLAVAGEPVIADGDVPLVLRHPIEPGIHRDLTSDRVSRVEPLLEPVLVEGRRVNEPDTLAAMRARREADLECLDAGVRRLVNPHVYHVSLTQQLWDLKHDEIAALRS